MVVGTDLEVGASMDLVNPEQELRRLAGQETPSADPPGAEPPRALKHDAGKAGLHLLPAVPLFEIARVLDHGAEKYGEYNWCKGFKASRLFAALMRHLWAWWSGEDNDSETGFSHLAHAACCLLFMMDLRHTRLEDDRPKGLIAREKE
jgi:dATP/dGTP diphosphohydrolase